MALPDRSGSTRTSRLRWPRMRRGKQACSLPLHCGGDSSHHLGFPGTISLRTETLMQVVYDVVRSLARHGFRRILLINGHKWTNLPALTSAAHHPRIRAARRADGGCRSDVSGARHRDRNQARQRAPRGRAGSLARAYKFPHTIRTEKLSDAACD